MFTTGGLLTRQLHDALNELGYADKLRGSMGELPDAQKHRPALTGEAAEKVLNRVRAKPRRSTTTLRRKLTQGRQFAGHADRWLP